MKNGRCTRIVDFLFYSKSDDRSLCKRCAEKLSSIQNLYFEEVFEAAFYLEKMEELVMSFHKPEQIAELVIEAGVQK